jgi:oligoribonuclease (3'-5' exoribonuclease)
MRCQRRAAPVCGAGLNLDSDVIIEIAVIITDGALQKRIMVSNWSFT